MSQLKQIHAQLAVHGLLSDTLTFSGLISFCSLNPNGDLHHARQLFDGFTAPNRFMYNTLIRAYSNSKETLETTIILIRRMMAEGLPPNNFTFPFVLKTFAEALAFLEAVLVHSMIIKTGYGSQVFVMNALLHVYVVCGRIISAHKVFDEIPMKSIVSWNSMIDGYSRLCDCTGAFSLFVVMRRLGLEPDEFSLASLFSVCAQSGNVEMGRLLHCYLLMTRSDNDLVVGNALLDMYGKCGELQSAQTCFDRMLVRNAVSWTSLICAYAKNGLLEFARQWFDEMPERSIGTWNAMIDCHVYQDRCQEALDLYECMRSSGIIPNEATLVSVLSACSQSGNMVMGKRTHDYIVQNIANPSLTLLNSTVDMYAKCGHLDIAYSLFRLMKEKNSVSWNVVIAASAVHGNAWDAVELFRSMVGQGFLTDSITFVGLLSACNHGGLLEVGQHYFEAMDDVYNVAKEIEHYACMVDLFGRKGYLCKAIELLRCMPMKPDTVIWGALLGACRIQGDVGMGLHVMKQVLELEYYRSGLYVLMSNLFCEAQRWEDVRKLRKVMNVGRIRKSKGRSMIEIGGNIHEFLVGDLRHEGSSAIYLLLNELTDHVMALSFSTPSGLLLHTEE